MSSALTCAPEGAIQLKMTGFKIETGSLLAGYADSGMISEIGERVFSAEASAERMMLTERVRAFWEKT